MALVITRPKAIATDFFNLDNKLSSSDIGGIQFVYNGYIYTVTSAISSGGTITIDGNCELSNNITDQVLSEIYLLLDDIKNNKLSLFVELNPTSLS